MTRREIGWLALFAVLIVLTLAPVIERAKHAIVFIETMQGGMR